jgi:uncharacterized protein (DUF58 family)
MVAPRRKQVLAPRILAPAMKQKSRSAWARLRSMRLLLLPTPRLCAYFGLGAIFWVAAAIMPGLEAAALMYPLALGGVAVVDALVTPRARDFEFSRAVDERLNLGVANTVGLRVRRAANRAAADSRAARPIEMWVRDEAPEAWPLRGSLDKADAPDGASRVPLLKLEVAPDEEAHGSYEVLPTRRGDWTFGGIHARLDSPLGLWRRWIAQDANQSVKVFPDVSAVERYEWMLRNGRSQEIGLHRLRLRGQGTDFESLRDYTPGDEFKNINWKASARRNKLISTNYEVERDQTIILALDCGRMMTALALTRAPRSRANIDRSVPTVSLNDFLKPENNAAPGASTSLQPGASTLASGAAREGAGGEEERVALSKLDCAINASVLLAHVAASMGDAVGLLLFDDEVRAWLPPRKGRVHTGTLIEALYAVQPRLVEPDFGGAYAFLGSRKIRRSLVVTFTDVIDPFASQELVAAAASLRRSHNALCVSISNRDVAEMAAQFPLDLPEMFDKSMAQRLLWQRNSALENLRARGVGVLDVDASALSAATVDRYLEMKGRGAI